MRNHVFEFEIRKLFRTPAFYIFLGMSIFSICIISLVYVGLSNLFREEDFQFSSNFYAGSMLPSSTLWDCLMIFVCAYLCRDFADGTIKNIYGRGVSRTQFYFVRLAIVGIVSVIYLLVAVCADFLFTSAFMKTTYVNAPNYLLITYICYFIVTLTYASFAVFSSYSLKKMGGAIAVCIVCPGIISYAFTAVEAILQIKEVISYSTHITPYWFTNVPTACADAYAYIDEDITEASRYGLDFYITEMSIATSWTAAFVLFGWLVARKDKA